MRNIDKIYEWRYLLIGKVLNMINLIINIYIVNF